MFNLAGITIWNYFKSCLTATSNTFGSNVGIFSKVYFPRIISPLSVVISNLIKFGIQLLIFIGFYIYYLFSGAVISINMTLIFFPLLIVGMGLLGLGLGMIISSLVTKYRDLKYLLNFGVQLLMYISAVMYPLTLMREKLPAFAWLVEYNPLAYIIEAGRYMLLSTGELSVNGLIFAIVSTLVFLFLGMIVFNRTEKTFLDTI